MDNCQAIHCFKDPFFTMMPHDILNECDVENWFGERKRI